jgi:hypothetical protein
LLSMGHIMVHIAKINRLCSRSTILLSGKMVNSIERVASSKEI